MTAKLTDIAKYSPKSSDLFFFDNNVWMYLFCPLGNYNKRRQRLYSIFLNSVKSSSGTIFISSMILSEFANRFLKMDFEQWKLEVKKYSANYKKDYVGTDRYKDTIKLIQLNISNIMKCCVKSSDNFNSIDLEDVFKHFSEIDFNDSYYIELSKLGKWKLVSDDGDFTKYQGHDLEVITINN
jgi:hypothetical protein